ncbi:hypothetical protein J6590_087075 [Homalodisca vitripennis]|nr:hypothetical protein J6590_087075 [Homalodisca vitripennis]
MLSSMESRTSRAQHRKECITTNFCNAVFHGILDQHSGTQEGAYHNKFQCFFHGVFVQRAAHRRSVSHQISAMLSSMESWITERTRKECIIINFCNAVFHGVWDQQSVTLEYDSYPPPFSILHSPSWYYTITSGHLEHTSWWHFLLDPLKWVEHVPEPSPAPPPPHLVFLVVCGGGRRKWKSRHCHCTECKTRDNVTRTRIREHNNISHQHRREWDTELYIL